MAWISTPAPHYQKRPIPIKQALSLPTTQLFKYLRSMLSINGKLKFKIHQSSFRSVALYGSECWATKQDNSWRLAVMKTKMLRWTIVAVCYDHIRSEDIRHWYEVVPIMEKLWESIFRRLPLSIAKIGMNIEVDGKRPKVRPKQRWIDTLDGDLKSVRLHPDKIRRGRGVLEAGVGVQFIISKWWKRWKSHQKLNVDRYFSTNNISTKKQAQFGVPPADFDYIFANKTCCCKIYPTPP